MNLRNATPEEIEAVEWAVLEFREHWAAMRPPFPCPFEGTPEDVGALDYLDYEVGFPTSGLLGAALVWGDVLRRHGPFRWLVSDRGDYLLGTAEHGWPNLLLWPFARVLESRHSSAPGPGDRFRWLTERAVVDCLASGLGSDDARRLSALLGAESGGYADAVTAALRALPALPARHAAR